MWTIPLNAAPMRLADLLRLPADLACRQMQQQTQLQFSLFDALQRPGATATDRATHVWREGFATLLSLPFDMARVQHAASVLAGALPRSLLESTRFERRLGAMERLLLGPLARSV